MGERYDLEKMVKEIERDEAVSGHTKKKEMLSQEDIKALVEKKRSEKRERTL